MIPRGVTSPLSMGSASAVCASAWSCGVDPEDACSDCSCDPGSDRAAPSDASSDAALVSRRFQSAMQRRRLAPRPRAARWPKMWSWPCVEVSPALGVDEVTLNDEPEPLRHSNRAPALFVVSVPCHIRVTTGGCPVGISTLGGARVVPHPTVSSIFTMPASIVIGSLQLGQPILRDVVALGFHVNIV